MLHCCLLLAFILFNSLLKTTAEFIEFATATSSDVKRFSGSQEYLTCVKELVRQTCDVDDLSVEDVRAVIQTLNTLVNKKLKEEKGKKGKGTLIPFRGSLFFRKRQGWIKGQCPWR